MTGGRPISPRRPATTGWSSGVCGAERRVRDDSDTRTEPAMRAVVMLVLLGMALSASAAPAPLPKRNRGEKPSLDGEWKMISDSDRQLRGPENVTMVIR